MDKKYKFVRIINTDIPNDKGMWAFAPQCMSDVHEHFNRFCVPLFMAANRHQMKVWQKTLNEDIDDNFSDTSEYYAQGHFINKDMDLYVIRLSKMIEQYSRARLIGRAVAGSKLMKEAISSRETYFMEGNKFYMFDGTCDIFLLVEKNYKIVEETYSETLVYPVETKPTLADVRFIMWDNGKHYYAKIFNIDIVWEGQQKWNTKAEAESAAKNFIDANWK